MDISRILDYAPVKVSVPCRVDFGGTLDISTLYLPLAHLNPVGFNMAMDLRTTVTLSPYQSGRVKVSSRGFDTAEFDQGAAPLPLRFHTRRADNQRHVRIQFEIRMLAPHPCPRGRILTSRRPPERRGRRHLSGREIGCWL